jgi:hypothetical protein
MPNRVELSSGQEKRDSSILLPKEVSSEVPLLRPGAWKSTKIPAKTVPGKSL